MTKLCQSCLGCQQLENENFHGVHICHRWINNLWQENEQIRMDFPERITASLTNDFIDDLTQIMI